MRGLDTLSPDVADAAKKSRINSLIHDKDIYDDAGNQTVGEWIEMTLEKLNVDPQSPEGMELTAKLKAIGYQYVLQEPDEELDEMTQIAESFRRFTKILKGWYLFKISDNKSRLPISPW